MTSATSLALVVRANKTNKWKPRWDKLLSVAIVVLLSTAMEGCVVVMNSHIIEEPFTKTKLPLIHSGKVKQQDLLQWFGPPKVVVRNEDFITVQQYIEQKNIPKRFKASYARVQMPLLYYYEDRSMSWAMFGMLCQGCFIPVGGGYTIQKLWILVDERNGMAVDYIQYAY